MKKLNEYKKTLKNKLLIKFISIFVICKNINLKSTTIMSLSATLQIGDNQLGNYNKEYKVVHCQFKCARGYNFRMPDTIARNKTIAITVVAPGKEDLSLYDWYIDRTLLSGRIVFDLSGQAMFDERPKIVQFEDASCFSLSESYHIDDETRRLIHIEIAAEKTIVDSILFTNY